jgi:hypothetical protein
MKSQIYSYIILDQVKAMKLLKKLMKDNPEREEALIDYWKVLRNLKNNHEMRETAKKLTKLCE